MVTMLPWQPTIATKFVEVLLTMEIKPAKFGLMWTQNNITIIFCVCCYGDCFPQQLWKFLTSKFTWPNLVMIRFKSSELWPKECLHWSTWKTCKTGFIYRPNTAWYLVGSFTWIHSKEHHYSLNWNTELWLVQPYLRYPIFLRFVIENPIEKINSVFCQILGRHVTGYYQLMVESDGSAFAKGLLGRNNKTFIGLSCT